MVSDGKFFISTIIRKRICDPKEYQQGKEQKTCEEKEENRRMWPVMDTWRLV